MKPDTPDFPELDFDERSHIYRLNGEIIPSVSAVMSPLSQFKYAGVQLGTLNTAASKGTEVHNAIEVYLNYFDSMSWQEVSKLLFGMEEDFLDRQESYERRVFKIHGSALLNMAIYQHNEQHYYDTHPDGF